jgi:hypothetical protein
MIGAASLAVFVAIAALFCNRFAAAIDKDGLGTAMRSGQGFAFYFSVIVPS